MAKNRPISEIIRGYKSGYPGMVQAYKGGRRDVLRGSTTDMVPLFRGISSVLRRDLDQSTWASFFALEHPNTEAYNIWRWDNPYNTYRPVGILAHLLAQGGQRQGLRELLAEEASELVSFDRGLRMHFRDELRLGFKSVVLLVDHIPEHLSFSDTYCQTMASHAHQPSIPKGSTLLIINEYVRNADGEGKVFVRVNQAAGSTTARDIYLPREVVEEFRLYPYGEERFGLLRPGAPYKDHEMLSYGYPDNQVDFPRNFGPIPIILVGETLEGYQFIPAPRPIRRDRFFVEKKHVELLE
jgi:hypothetical protein